MCNNITNLLFLVLITTSFSVAAKDNVIKVYDKGLDGSARYYSVVCTDGTKTNITHMLGEYGKAKRTGGAAITSNELEQPKPRPKRNTGGETLSAETNTAKQTAEDLKRKVLNLVGAKNKLEVCIYPINKNRECRAYESIDAAAEAACNL